MANESDCIGYTFNGVNGSVKEETFQANHASFMQILCIIIGCEQNRSCSCKPCIYRVCVEDFGYYYHVHAGGVKLFMRTMHSLVEDFFVIKKSGAR